MPTILSVTISINPAIISVTISIKPTNISVTIIIKPTIISKTISIKPTYLENLFLGALSANFPFLFSKINCIFSPLLFVLAQLLISSTILLALFLLPLFIFLISVFRISKKYVNLKERKENLMGKHPSQHFLSSVLHPGLAFGNFKQKLYCRTNIFNNCNELMTNSHSATQCFSGQLLFGIFLDIIFVFHF